MEAELQREIGRRERLERELVRKNAELEDFTFRVAHDLKNHLLTIRTVLSLGLADPVQAQEQATLALQTSDHLIDFVDRLLMLARAGRVIATRRPVDLESLVREGFEQVRAEPDDAELVIHAPLATVHGDRPALLEVFHNLSRNAMQYRAPDRPLRVEVSTMETPDHVEIRYTDNGQGIPAQGLDRIFELRHSGHRPGHFGFGLLITKKIVEAHGGHVRAESAGPGQGATFVIEVPRVSS